MTTISPSRAEEEVLQLQRHHARDLPVPRAGETLCFRVHEKVGKLRPREKWGGQSQGLPHAGRGLRHSGLTAPAVWGACSGELVLRLTPPGCAGEAPGAVQKSLWEGSCHPGPKTRNWISRRGWNKDTFIEYCGSCRRPPRCPGAALHTLRPLDQPPAWEGFVLHLGLRKHTLQMGFPCLGTGRLLAVSRLGGLWVGPEGEAGAGAEPLWLQASVLAVLRLPTCHAMPRARPGEARCRLSLSPHLQNESKDPEALGSVCWDDQCSPHWPGQAGPLCSDHCKAVSPSVSVWAGQSAPAPLHLSQGWGFALLSEELPAVSLPGSWTLVQAGLAHPSCPRGQRGWRRRWGSPHMRKGQRPTFAVWGGRQVPKPVFWLLPSAQ